MLKGLVHHEYHVFTAALRRAHIDPYYKWLWYEMVLYSCGLLWKTNSAISWSRLNSEPGP